MILWFLPRRFQWMLNARMEPFLALWETCDTCHQSALESWEKKSGSWEKFCLVSRRWPKWDQDGTVPSEKKRRKNSTSLATFVSQSYILFSGSDGNTSLIERENMNIFLFWVKYLRWKAPGTAFLHTKSIKKKRQEQKKCCLFNVHGGWRKKKKDLQIVQRPVAWLQFISK